MATAPNPDLRPVLLTKAGWHGAGGARRPRAVASWIAGRLPLLSDPDLVGEALAGRDWWVDGWWLHRRLSTGTREQRVELERAVSAQARSAHSAYEHVHRVVEVGGGGALEGIARLGRGRPQRARSATAATTPLRE